MTAGKRHRLFLVLAGFALLLCACRVELYSGLDEKEANRILAVLLRNGIDGEKVPGKENVWGLRVEKADLARAVELLQAGGFPRDRFASIGEIFRKQGLVSSPMQERILYLYALSQEISETLSHIDGVLTARVHVVIPENNPLTDTLRPSSRRSGTSTASPPPRKSFPPAGATWCPWGRPSSAGCSTGWETRSTPGPGAPSTPTMSIPSTPTRPIP